MVTQPGMARCDSCGGSVASNLVVQLGSRTVCSKCKDKVAREMAGAAPVHRLRYAGFWIRFVASFVDGIILNVFSFVLGMVVGLTAPASGGEGAVIVAQLLSFAVVVLYHTLFVGLKGATPGKMALGLRIVRPDGSPVGIGRAIGRYFAYFLSAIIFLIGYIMAAFNDEKKALHDIICDTRVVYKN